MFVLYCLRLTILLSPSLAFVSIIQHAQSTHNSNTELRMAGIDLLPTKRVVLSSSGREGILLYVGPVRLDGAVAKAQRNAAASTCRVGNSKRRD